MYSKVVLELSWGCPRGVLNVSKKLSFSCSGVDIELASMCLRAVQDLFKNCPGVIFKLSESCLVFVPELFCSTGSSIWTGKKC